MGKENRQRVIDVIDDVDHMSKLVNELLSFLRAEMNSKTAELERLDLKVHKIEIPVGWGSGYQS